MEIKDAVTHIRHTGVLWRGLWMVGRRPVRLAAPAVMAFVPLGVVLLVTVMPWLGDAGVVVNGEFVLFGAAPGPLWGWLAVALVLGVVVLALSLPATVIVAAGLILDRPVSPAAALRVAVRHWSTVLPLVGAWALGVVAGAAVALGVAELSGSPVLALLAMAVVVALVLPVLLAVPAAVLEGRSAWGALGRACRLLAFNGVLGTFRLIVGVVAIPALVALGVELLGDIPAVERLGTALPAGLVAMVGGIAGVVLNVGIAAVQAAVLARTFLFLLAHRDGEPAFEEVARLLPEAPELRPRAPVVLAALVLPGLLYGGAVVVNPLGWPQVNDINATQDLSSASGRLLTNRADQDDLQAWQGANGQLMLLSNGTRESTLLTCAGSPCHDVSLAWRRDRSVQVHTGSARLADGRVALVVWTPDDGEGDTDFYRLKLLICDVKGCSAAPGVLSLATAEDLHLHNVAVDLAGRPAGGLVVALARRDDGGGDNASISFVFCADAPCSHPETRMSARLDGNFVGFERGLTMVVGADDRPVAAQTNITSGAVSVISCADPGCERARVTMPVNSEGDIPFDRWEGSRFVAASLAVREDARPVIAYSHLRDGAITLLDCRSADCAQVDQATLAGPDGGRTPPPALALDGAGRALVAYRDLEHRQVILASCTGTRCERTRVARIQHGSKGGLAITLDGQARPVIVWTDGDEFMKGPWAFRVTTVLNVEDAGRTDSR
ncbi:hypothetical protein [Nonomuraea sp. CA-141351]|uniref:hypothetical protein n=1 Tax=Nonomuraea sp. CA-141351 TaxID=3239996 RepID=UPI003D92C497